MVCALHCLRRSAHLHRRTKRIVTTALFAVVWAAAIAGGLRALAAYENTPGTAGAVPPEWPSRVILPAADRATLVMAAHPRCPCTDASIAELAQIMAEADGKIAAYVLFATPKGAAADWEQTSLRSSAAAIPGVTVVTDTDGVECRRFGAETSGHTTLFSAQGRLLFNGGITGSRGHAGENAGESAIVALAKGETPVLTKTRVFGCPISDHSATKTAPSAPAQ
jgi:hypothetical protein